MGDGDCELKKEKLEGMPDDMKSAIVKCYEDGRIIILITKRRK